MVTIEVGAEKEHFVVHQSFLCAKSPYFDKALSGSFQEATTRFIRLPEFSPILFRIFVAWLYHGSLSYLPTVGRTVEEDFKSLIIPEGGAEPYVTDQCKMQGDPGEEESDSDDSIDDIRKSPPGHVVVNNTGNDTAPTSESVESTEDSVTKTTIPLEDDPTTWPFHIIIQLYVLADYLQTRELKADSMNALIDAGEKQMCVEDLNEIQYVYNKTPAGSPLRKYMVHHAAYWYPFENDGPTYEILPVEFLAAVMVTNSRRLPEKQCQECHSEAFASTRVLAFQNDERDPEEDLPPYQRDLCLYHEHSDEEEREACRLRREGTKPTA